MVRIIAYHAKVGEDRRVEKTREISRGQSGHGGFVEYICISEVFLRVSQGMIRSELHFN